MLNCKISSFLFLLFTLSVFGQEIDSVYVDSINKEVSFLRYEGKFEEAYTISNKLLLSLQKSQSDPQLFADTYFTRSRIEIELGEYNKAFETSDKALKIYLQKRDSIGLAKTYNLIGVLYYHKNQLDSTVYYYQKSLVLKEKLHFDDQEMAVSAYNLAMVYEDTGLLNEAMELYFTAEKYLLKNTEFLSFLPDVYIGIAHIYKYKQDYDQAEIFADNAMDTGLRSYGEFNPNMTFVYTSYANILISKKKYRQAIELLKKGLQIREQNFGKYHKWTCESYTTLAVTFELDQQIDQAEYYFRKAIEIGEKVQNQLYLANAKTSLAIMYCDEHIKPKEVDELLKESLGVYLDIYNEKNDFISEVYYYLAKNAVNRIDQNDFFHYLKEVLNTGNYNENNLNQTVAPFVILSAFELEDEWYSKEYHKNQNIESLKKKFALIDKQVQLIKFIQKNYSSEISKISMANDYRKVFEKGLNSCYELYQITGEDQYLEKAFELSETNRNTALLEGLQDTKFKLFSEIPEDLLIYENNSKKNLAKIKMDLFYAKNSGSPDKEELSYLINERIKITTELDSIHKIYAHKYPKYADLKFKDRTIHISDVQNNLDKNSQFIIYFLGTTNLFIFNITSDQVSFIKSTNSKEIISEINTLKNNLVNLVNTDALGLQLYAKLLETILLKDKRNVIIIPDDVLNYIPFEILKNTENHYLIENYNISYSGSARLDLELRNDHFDYNIPNYWLGFSPNYTGKDQLSSNKEEVFEIADLLGGDTYTGEESTKVNFIRSRNDASILHLAMHAEINNKNPLYNKLIFSDGELTSSEIYVSNIKANLAVLSACNTGFGKLEKGEGIINMARAFNFAGVPSVLMSLWKVPDKETKKIMIAFYKHLKNGETKSLALKNAKLDYLASIKDINLRHPFYWSGFVLNGNIKQLIPANQNNYYLISGVLLFGLMILGIKIKSGSKS